MRSNVSDTLTPPHRVSPCPTWDKNWRRGPELNRRIEVLQTSALPLGYRALTIYHLLVASTLTTMFLLFDLFFHPFRMVSLGSGKEQTPRPASQPAEWSVLRPCKRKRQGKMQIAKTSNEIESLPGPRRSVRRNSVLKCRHVPRTGTRRGRCHAIRSATGSACPPRSRVKSRLSISRCDSPRSRYG